MHDDNDRSSKWLIQHHGDAILRLAGVRDIPAWRPLQAEVVQPKQLPDGLIQVDGPAESEPDLYLIEIATYPEKRVQEQVLRDAALVYLDRRVLPEVLVLVLRPRGRTRIATTQKYDSPRAWTRWQVKVRVVELWTVPAEDLFATGDVGVIPWVPLSQFDGPPEPVLRKCRQRIDELAPPEEHENFLAVAQVLT